MKVFAALLLLAAVAGCSSSGTGGQAAPSSPSTTASASVTYATTAEAITAACGAFDRFTTQLARLTPRGSQMTLVPLAQAVQAPLLHTRDVLDDRGSAMLDDVNAFVGHIGSSTWPENGTPLDPQITAVRDDCASS